MLCRTHKRGLAQLPRIQVRSEFAAFCACPFFIFRSWKVGGTSTNWNRLVKRVHIIGKKNHGKTTLVVELVQALSNRGLRVGTIKHTHHHHELDSPGKDSHRHRESGAEVVGICSPSMSAVFWPHSRDTAQETGDGEHKYVAFAPMFAQCDLVLVEGDTQTDATKVEVWRSEAGTTPLAEVDKSIAAVVTDDVLDIELGISVWPRSDIESLVDKLLALWS